MNSRIVWAVSKTQKDCLKLAIEENKDIINDIRGIRFDATVQPTIEKVVGDWIDECVRHDDDLCMSYDKDTIIFWTNSLIPDDVDRVMSKVPGFKATYGGWFTSLESPHSGLLVMAVAQDIFELEL